MSQPSATPGSKWQVRFYAPGRTLPVQTHDAGNAWERAGLFAARLARHPGRSGMACVLVNTRPTAAEREDYEHGEGCLRWLLTAQTRRELEFTGLGPDDSVFASLTPSETPR
jgi:hypothetical protein